MSQTSLTSISPSATSQEGIAHSALATARVIDDIGRISYPEGIKGPNAELNAYAKDNKFRYDRDFLLQFMDVCKEKPDVYTPLDALGIKADQTSSPMSRGGLGRHQQSRSTALPTPDRQNTASSPISSAGFAKLGTTPPSAGNRTRSKRGEKQNNSNKVNAGQQPRGSASSTLSSGIVMQGLEPIAPLEMSATRWVPTSISKNAVSIDPDSPEMVNREVKSLLNKLTMEKFDSISDQIMAWMNKSEKGKDGRTLNQVVRLVFEHATDAEMFSEMYARLCRKMMERISSAVQDDGIKNAEGKPIAGSQLYRKYLLNMCQDDFEHSWNTQKVNTADATAKILYLDEYYVHKAKRRDLGLVRFIGELFKQQMLTERIIHECVKKLLRNVDNPEEKEIEKICKLLMTVGAILDTAKARSHIDVYFARMKEFSQNSDISWRVRYLSLDVIESRERRWVARNRTPAPATIVQTSKATTKEEVRQENEQHRKEKRRYLQDIEWYKQEIERYQKKVEWYQQKLEWYQHENERYQQEMGTLRGGPIDDCQISDGRTVASGPSRVPPKEGDLSQFAKINKAAPMTFGTTSVFAGEKDSKACDSISRTNPSRAMYSLLGTDIPVDPALSKGSWLLSRKLSVDTGHGALEPLPQRRKLKLLPSKRSGPSEDNAPAEAMTEAMAKKKIDEDSKEFFAVRDLDEAECYFTTLPQKHHFRLVDKLVASAIVSKEADAQLVGDLFARAANRGLCSAAAFEDGFISIAELLDDIAIDEPKAFNLMAMMMNGVGLDEERRTRIAGQSMDSDKLLALLS